jgi:hypothetical protein
MFNALKEFALGLYAGAPLTSSDPALVLRASTVQDCLPLTLKGVSGGIIHMTTLLSPGTVQPYTFCGSLSIHNDPAHPTIQHYYATPLQALGVCYLSPKTLLGTQNPQVQECAVRVEALRACVTILYRNGNTMEYKFFF